QPHGLFTDLFLEVESRSAGCGRNRPRGRLDEFLIAIRFPGNLEIASHSNSARLQKRAFRALAARPALVCSERPPLLSAYGRYYPDNPRCSPIQHSQNRPLNLPAQCSALDADW